MPPICGGARKSWRPSSPRRRLQRWPEAAEKARYLLGLLAAGLPPEDTRRRKLVAAVLDDFERLGRDP